jgi:hypothetical protein
MTAFEVSWRRTSWARTMGIGAAPIIDNVVVEIVNVVVEHDK